MRPETRQRLADMRTGLLNDMDRQIEAGQLALLAGINAGLAALDAEGCPNGKPTARAVVSDDGREIRLTFYTENGAAVSAPLVPDHLALRAASRSCRPYRTQTPNWCLRLPSASPPTRHPRAAARRLGLWG
jgi:hypothetical protein